MSQVEPWLVAQAERLARLPSLEEALLGARPLRYVSYRLRYVYFRALLRCAFRIVELGLFISTLPFEVLGPVLGIRSAMLLADALHWGALETLRQDVREFASQAQLPQATRAVRFWLALGCVLAMGALTLAGFWIWLRPWLGLVDTGPESPMRGGPDFIDAFVVACSLRWGLDALSRTYHSGVYAVRRVYRPLWSLVLADAADIGMFAALFVWLGPWGMSAALLLVGLLRAGLSWRFTRQLYAQLKLRVGSPRLWFRALLHWRPGSMVRRSTATALANGVAQVDTLLILGLLSAPASEQGPLLLAALFHVLAPILSAAQTWVRLFYFDFKRLEAWGAPFLLARFEALLARVAWLAVLPVSALTFALLAAFWRGPSLILALELSCLSCVRSWLALRHMRAYSLSDHRFLRRLFLGMLLVTASTQVLATLPPEQALGALVLLAALSLVLLGRSERSLASQGGRRVLGASIWLGQLLTQRLPVTIGLARVDRRLTSSGRVARALCAHLHDATLGRLGSDTLVWFTQRPPERSALLAATGGTLRELYLADDCNDGPAAFARGVPSAVWQRIFGEVSKAAANATTKLDRTQVLTELQRQLVQLHEPLRLVSVELALSESFSAQQAHRPLRQLILDAARGHASFKRIGEREVLALAPGGAPEALLIAPASAGAPAPWKPAAAALMQRAEMLLTLFAAPCAARALAPRKAR